MYFCLTKQNEKMIDLLQPPSHHLYTIYIFSLYASHFLSLPKKEKLTVCAISICFADRLSRQIFALRFYQNTLCILFTKKKGDQFTLPIITANDSNIANIFFINLSPFFH